MLLNEIQMQRKIKKKNKDRELTGQTGFFAVFKARNITAIKTTYWTSIAYVVSFA